MWATGSALTGGERKRVGNAIGGGAAGGSSS